MSTKAYDINIHRDGKWWMVEIPELDGLTQARRLSEAPDMAREWIAVTTGTALDDVSVHVGATTVDGVDVLARRRELDEARAALEATQALVADLMAGSARDLVARDVPVRDAGEALGVSPQRISQLAGI